MRGAHAAVLRLTVPLALALACRGVADPPLPTAAEPFTPPSYFRTWWEMTAACVGRSGSFEAVSWYVVPRVNVFADWERKSVSGYWSPRSNQIVLAGNAARSGAMVRHEMLHALLRVGGHPREAFLERCAGIVDCDDTCVAEAGPPPGADPRAREVPSDSLEVTITMDPSRPAATVDGGALRVTIEVRNPAAGPVVVPITPLASGWRPRAFSYEVSGAGWTLDGTVIARDPSVTRFAPGEVKRQVWDFLIGSDLARGELPPGTYRVRAAYDRTTAELPAVELGP